MIIQSPVRLEHTATGTIDFFHFRKILLAISCEAGNGIETSLSSPGGSDVMHYIVSRRSRIFWADKGVPLAYHTWNVTRRNGWRLCRRWKNYAVHA